MSDSSKVTIADLRNTIKHLTDKMENQRRQYKENLERMRTKLNSRNYLSDDDDFIVQMLEQAAKSPRGIVGLETPDYGRVLVSVNGSIDSLLEQKDKEIERLSALVNKSRKPTLIQPQPQQTQEVTELKLQIRVLTEENKKLRQARKAVEDILPDIVKPELLDEVLAVIKH